MSKIIDLTGKRFGRLVVVGLIGKTVSSKNVRGYDWLCQCDCGQTKSIFGNSLRRGFTVSCGCFSKELATERIRVTRRKRRTEPRPEEECELLTMKRVAASYKCKAKKHGVEFRLTVSQCIYLFNKPCFYCGMRGTNTRKNPDTKTVHFYNGIDRMDSSKGYTVQNVVPSCWLCNMAKRDSNFDDFVAWIKQAAENIGKSDIAALRDALERIEQ